MGLYSTDALVIRVRNLGEADKVITLLTEQEGKVQAVARGARRPRNRLVGVTQLFTQCRVSLFRSQGLGTLSQAEIKQSFRLLREDLLRTAAATYICELVDELVGDRERHETLYYLLLATLHLLCEDLDLQVVLRAFELRLLSLLGYQPHLESCVVCGAAPAGARVTFSPGAGGVVCPSCPPGEGGVVALSRGSLEMLRRLSTADMRRLGVLRPGAAAMSEMQSCLEEYITYRLEKRLKSLDFLHTVWHAT